LLRDDHVGEFSGEVDVRLLDCAAGDGAVSTSAGLPDVWGTGCEGSLVIVAARLGEALRVGEAGDCDLTEGERLVIAELTFDGSIGEDRIAG
jgi:hypothetical protein